jgi:hypothetical protein
MALHGIAQQRSPSKKKVSSILELPWGIVVNRVLDITYEISDMWKVIVVGGNAIVF